MSFGGNFEHFGSFVEFLELLFTSPAGTSAVLARPIPIAVLQHRVQLPMP